MGLHFKSPERNRLQRPPMNCATSASAHGRLAVINTASTGTGEAMSDYLPVAYIWDGESMRPVNGGFMKRCDKQFVVGETYVLEVREERSSKQHAFFFASVGEAWKNLPEEAVARYPNPEYLRRWALVKAGYADEKTVLCATKAEATRTIATVKGLNEYAIIVQKGTVLKIFTAQSQSIRAMDRKTFKESADAVLAILAEVIDVKPSELRNQGEAP